MKKFLTFLLTIFIILIISCEIGLGASVDTEAPNLEITMPPADAVIRDTFALSGIWTDDGSISEVIVTMTRLDNGQTFEYEGLAETGEGDGGTWQADINPFETGLGDGTYEALVAITDNGGHTTTMARSFTIDNTPPIMILQKPSTTLSDAANRFDTFGQVFSIVGQASDDNLIDKIDVSVYFDASCSDESLLNTITLDNVPPTIDLDVATFVNGTSNDYSAIYGSTILSGLSSPRYFKLEVYDTARQYNASGMVDETGNKQDSYYLYKDISDLITEYKATGLYKILSGNRSADSGDAMSRLENDKREVGKFKLNPDNSPTYIVSARTVLADGETLNEAVYQLTSGNNFIEVQIDPGLDNNPIEEDTIGIYLKECNVNGEPLANAQKIWLIRPVEAASPEFENDTNSNAHSESNATITPSGDSYKFKTKNVISSLTYEGLGINKYYRIYVTGKDRNDMVVVPRNDSDTVISSNPFYAFKLHSSGEQIELIPTVSPVYVTSNATTNGINPSTLEDVDDLESSTLENTLTVTLQYQGGNAPYDFWEKATSADLVDITNDSNLTNSLTSTPKQAIRTINRTAASGSPSLQAFADGSITSIEYQITGAGGATSNVKPVSFIVDNIAPVITDGSLKVGTANYNASAYFDKQYLNISGEVNEPNLETVYYYVSWPDRGAVPSNFAEINDGEISKFTAADGANATNANYKKFEFKAVEFRDNATAIIPNKLFIQAKDKAGNLSPVKQYTINVDTSLPDFEAKYYKIGNGNLTAASGTAYILSDSEITLYGNYKDLQSGVDQLGIARVSGDTSTAITPASLEYSISEITNEASANSASFGAYSSISDKSSIRSWKAVFTPGAAGTLKVTGTNIAGKSDSKNVFTMSLDSEDPQLQNLKLREITGTGATEKDAFKKEADSKYYVNNTTAAGKTFKITGLATDDFGVAKVGITVTNTGTSSPAAALTIADITNPTGAWTFDISGIIGWSGGATVVVTATDKSGRTSTDASGTIEIVFDNSVEAPDPDKFVTPTPTETESSRFIFEGQTGSVTDSGAGLDKVDIAFTSAPSLGDPAEPSAAQVTVTPASAGSWSSTVEFENSAFENVFVSSTGTHNEGTKYLWVRAWDKAGNVSSWKSKAFTYDKHAPTIEFTSTTPGTKAFKNEGFTIEVTATDISGIASVSGNYPGLATPFTLEPVSDQPGKYAKAFVVGSTGTENNLADGAYNFTITATDNAGKPSSVTRTITVDTTNPIGTFASATIPEAVPVSDQNWYKATSVRFTLTTTEENIATVQIKKGADSDTTTSYEAMTGSSSGSSGSYAGTVTSLSEGLNTITAKMTDLAGNEGTATTTVYVDTTAPVLTVSGNLSYMPNAGFTINGTASDSGSGIKTLTIKEEHRAGDTADWDFTTLSGANGVIENAAAGWSKPLPLRAAATPDTPTNPEEGQYRYTIILKDKAGNEKSVQFETTVDTTAPIISITNPGQANTTDAKMGQTSIDTSSYQFKGGLDEMNAVSAIYYMILPSEAAPSIPEGNKLLASTWTGASWTPVSAEKVQTGFSWAFYRDIKTGTNPIAEGKYKIHMYALDGAGNLSDVASQEFHVDMAAPVVTANAPEYVNSTTNASAADPVADLRKVTITGTVAETHGILSFYIKRNDEDESSDGTSVTPAADGTWTFSDIPTADGTYTYTITATDLVGKTNATAAAPFTKTVIVDTVAPAYTTGTLKVGSADWDADSYYKDTTLKMSGSFTEETSGMDTLYYYVQYPSRTGTVPADLTAVDSENHSVADGDMSFKANSNAFSFTAENYADNTQTASNTLYIQAVDKAGNKSEVSSFNVNIDTTAPDLSTLYYQVGSGNYKAAGGTVYVNGTAAITVYGSYKDEQSGVNELGFSLAGTAISTDDITVTYSTGTPAAGATADETAANVASLDYDTYAATSKKQYTYWKAVFTPASGGAFGVNGSNGTYISGTTVGTKSEAPFTITLDTTLPGVNNKRLLIAADTDAYKKTITSGSGATATTVEKYYINNTTNTSLIISGIATDNIGVDKVELSIPGTGTTSGTSADYTNEGTVSEWKFENINLSGINANTNPDNPNAIATITVTDVAGNTKEEALNIYFDTTGPSGLHQADSASKDIYFRIGDAENDDITPTTAASYELTWNTNDGVTGVDTDVGKKYSDETYGNASTIKIRGNISDAGSGVKMIYYYVFDKPILLDNNIADTVTNPTETADNYKFKNNDKLRDYVAAHATGYFAPLATPQTKRVFYNVNSTSGLLGGTAFGTAGTQAYKNVVTNYYSTISGLDNQNNYLVIIAEDNTGNFGLDIATVGTEEKNYCQINLDVTPPGISLAAGQESTRYSNGQSALSFSGRVTDNLAGVKSLTFSVNGHTITASDTDTTYGSMTLNTTDTGNSKTDAAWTLTVNAAALQNSGIPVSGNVFVYGTVVDQAGTGNTQTVSVATIMMDNQAPTVNLTAPADADTFVTGRQINGIISLSGTASDNKELYEEADDTAATMKLYYTTFEDLGASTVTGAPADTAFGTSDASQWVEIATARHGNTWSFSNINTAALDGTTSIADNTPVYFMASAKDKAGNTGYSNRVTAIVDQDSDRPVIKFTNLKLNTGIAATSENPNAPYMSATNPLPFITNTLYGSVSDDDGISELHYQFAESDSALTESGWQTITLSSNAFTLSFTDGPKKLYFKVKDTGVTAASATGTNFISSASTTYSVSAPKLTDSESTPNKYGYRGGAENVTPTVTYLKVDTTAPWIGSLQFTTVTTGTPAATDWLSKSEINSKPFGGPNERKAFKIRIPAWDANDVQSVIMTLPGYGTDDTITFTDSGVNAGNETYTDATWWISPEIDVSTLTTGNKNCSITASDGVKPSEDSFVISVDNTAPEISAKNPSSTQYSSGSVIAYGETDLTHWKNTTSTDHPAEFMYYALSLDDTTSPADDYDHQSSATAITSWKNENDVTVTNPTGGNAAISYKPYYTAIKGGSFNWYVYFDGGASTDTETHAEAFKQFLITAGITTQALLDHPEPEQKFRTKVKAYLWVKAVDQVGNTTVIKHPILIDPQGDAPSVTIEYPESAGTSLGGPVTLRGSATDTKGNNPGIDSVWVQIISAINNGFDSSLDTYHTSGSRTAGGLGFTDTVTASTENGETSYSHAYTLTSFVPKMKDVKQWITAEKAGTKIYHVYTNISAASPTEVTAVGTGDAWADTADGSAYYIKANFSAGGSAWSLKINADKEFDPDTGKLNPIAYRVFAKDNDRNLSNYEQRLSVYDSDSPIISDLYLRQYEINETGAGAVTASRAYEDDMWIKGVWWLCGKASDPQGLSSLTVGSTSIPTSGVETEFKVMLDSGDGVDNLSIEIEASDTTDPVHTTTKICSINYDNTAPALITSGTNFNISSSVRNANGFYNFGSQVTENPVSGKAQSGFAYLAFWFERQTSGTNAKHVVFDVMRPKKKTVNGAQVNASEVNWTGLTEDSGLMWMSVSGITRNENALGTLTLSAANPNIHAGGLCKMGGSIYLIKSMSANGLTITIEGQPEASYTSAEFAIANVVNNTIENGSGSKSTADGSYGYFATVANDDGDHMVESVSKNGTTWTWDANINSQNMADGSIILHYAAFDKAGNVATGSVTGNVANNAPRLASLEVWSNFNENNTKDVGEYKTQYFMGMNRTIGGATVQRATSLTSELVVSGNDKDYDDDTTPGTSFMTVKATTRFTPELVGGNNELYYSYKYGNSSQLEAATVHYVATSIGNGHDDGIDEEKDSSGYYKLDDQQENAYIEGHKDVYMEIPGRVGAQDVAEPAGTYSLNAIGNSASTTNPTWFEYTIYDSTEGCADWGTSPTSSSTTGRLSAKFRVALNLQYQDTASPTVQIRPFYWNSVSENSVCWTNSGKAEGHIELEADLPSASFTTTGTGVNDRDPKVSGKIKIEGFAEDDIKLKEIWVQFAGHTSLGTAIKVADYTPTTATKWTTVEHTAAAGWDFSAQDVYCDGNGHKAKWTLTIDTAKRTNAADVNQALVVYAVDARGSADTNTSVHNGTAQTTSTAMTYYYRMDIVPYITGIDTALSKTLKSSIKNAYSRTTLGHYIARSNETMAVKGFNLGNSSTAPKYGTTSLTFNSDGNVNLPVSLLSSSGQIALTVNNIQTLNNLNDNNACGSYKTATTQITEDSSYAIKSSYAYNRMPNGNSNNLLTDDVVIDVWQFDSDAAKPMSGELREPSMQINPVTGVVGLAFVSGPADISMADSTNDYSYARWQSNFATFNNISFAYDALGNAHSTATGLDTNPKDKHAGRFSYFYSPWGTSLSGVVSTESHGNYNGKNAIRLESVAVPYIAGTLENLSLDNAYIRYKYNNEKIYEKQTFYDVVANGYLVDSSAGSVLTETRFSSPSVAATVHGTGDSATTAVYLAYYDSIQKQIRFRYSSGVPSTKGDKDNFVDNTGYFYNFTGITEKKGEVATDDATIENFMESSTENFSLIAGVDTQQGTQQTAGETYRMVEYNKTDADGNQYYKISNQYKRVKSIDNDNHTLEDENKPADLSTLVITETIWNKLHPQLQTRPALAIGETVDIFTRTSGKYNWIIQPDGLIYYSTDNPDRADQGRMTHIAIDIDYQNYSFAGGKKLNPDENYTVYQRVEQTEDYKYAAPANDQSLYFWPSPQTAVKESIPIYSRSFCNAYDTGYTGYKYVAIDAMTGSDAAHDVVVAVWHDGTGLRYAYNTDPTSGLDNGSAGGWQGNKVIFSEGGEHCTVKLDKNGGVHIAAYADGCLRYAYLTSYDAGYNEATDSVIVDSFTVTGERLNLDVGFEQVGNTSTYVAVPYITYYNGTAGMPTVAKLVVPASGSINYKAAGTDSDIFTGKWEISLVPSPSKLTTNLTDKMNIGLWKDSAGKIVTSTASNFTVTGAGSGKTSADNASATTNGTIYGNGTANPILGYAVESITGTYLETAQMK